MQRFTFFCLFLTGFTFSYATAIPVPVSPKKVILVQVDASGKAQIGRDTLTLEDLSKEIQNRLWKSFLGTGKMQDSIKLQFKGEVLMGTRAAAKDAVLKGQQLALQDISLQKHKLLFEDLTSRQQEKIKKQFPVLFQTEFQ